MQVNEFMTTMFPELINENKYRICQQAILEGNVETLKAMQLRFNITSKWFEECLSEIQTDKFESFFALNYVFDNVRACMVATNQQLMTVIQKLFDEIWDCQSDDGTQSKICLQLLAKCVCKFGLQFSQKQFETFNDTDVLLLVHYGAPLDSFRHVSNLKRIWRQLNYRRYRIKCAVGSCALSSVLNTIVMSYTTCVG